MNEVTGGPGEGNWVLSTEANYTSTANSIVFDRANAEGTITFDDGSTIDFSDIEEIQ